MELKRIAFFFNSAGVEPITSIITLTNSIIISSIQSCSAASFQMTGLVQNQFIGHYAGVTCLHQVTSTSFVSGSKDLTAKVWSIETGLPELDLLFHYKPISCIFSTSIGKICIVFTGSEDGIIRAWNLTNRIVVWEIRLENQVPFLIHYSSSSNRVQVLSELPQTGVFSSGFFTRKIIWNSFQFQ